MNESSSKGLLGVRVGEYALEELIDTALRSVEARTPPFTFACANPHSLVTARHDAEFRNALQECSAVVADGVGVTIAARIFGLDVGERITGGDFFLSLMARLNRRGARVFFLGSRTEVLDRILSRARREYPNLHVDVLSPPYGEWTEQENARIIERIRDARPDVLWVGMTAPKQEKWVHENRAALDVPVIGSIGAVFDFFACTVQRAPDVFCRLGLEWLYRLVREPQRLWRRTVISAPAFLWLVMREQLLAMGRNDKLV
jgi:N-acetylglucosaminyldiphosphoundecaprenol N-acetyl-beta-D-mannosaminyltransferase